MKQSTQLTVTFFLLLHLHGWTVSTYLIAFLGFPMSTPFIPFHFFPSHCSLQLHLPHFIFTSFLHSSSHSLSTSNCIFSFPFFLRVSWITFAYLTFTLLLIFHCTMKWWRLNTHSVDCVQWTRFFFIRLLLIYLSRPLTALAVYFRLNSPLSLILLSLFICLVLRNCLVSTRNSRKHMVTWAKERTTIRSSVSLEWTRGSLP